MLEGGNWPDMETSDNIALVLFFVATVVLLTGVVMVMCA